MTSIPTAKEDWALRAHPHKSHLQTFLDSIAQAQEGASLASMGNPVLLLLTVAATAYFSYAMLAIVTQRHLFGDGAWFLVKMLSENHVAIWNVAGWHDFFVGRFGAFAYQEFPTLWASRLGLRSLHELSIVYGITLFSFKPLSILLCYHFARDKRYILFPLVSLFAVTINSEGYMVTETHLMSALFWAALFGLLTDRELKRWDLLAMVVVSAPLLLCYETMAVYGLVLCGVSVCRILAISRSKWDKWVTACLSLWYGLGALLGILAIIFPRDLTNREGFLKSLFFMVTNDHIGARISCVVMLLSALVLVIPRSYRRIPNLLVGASILCSLAIPAYILRYPERTSLDVHILARTMNAIVPLGLAIVFLAVYFRLIEMSAGKYKRLFVIAAVLGICQSSWHLIATQQWSQVIVLVRSELRTRSGPVPYEGSLLSRGVVDGNPVRDMHAEWPLMPMSIIFADHGQVKALLLPAVGGYEPFNPLSEHTLPDLRRYGIDYRPYLDKLTAGTPSYDLGAPINFNARVDASGAREVGQWWEPEPWGTWTGRDAGLIINFPQNVKTDLVLEVLAGAFVNEKNPQITVQVHVNDVAVGSWNVSYTKGVPLYQTHTVTVPRAVLDKGSPAVIWFRTSNARSPNELGMGGDPRTLGLAVVRLRMFPEPR
jgi:hypothetical protein